MFWGIDLGGTKIEGVILENSDNLTPIARLRVPTEADLGYEHIIGQIKKLVDMLSEESGLTCTSLGLGHPGALDPLTGLMKNANTTALNGRPFGKDLTEALGIPVKFSNDANCFAVAEARMGAAKEVAPNAEVVFGIIMGTGVGGGVVVRGSIINGRHGIGGEWGHNLLEPDGNLCYCGRVGCVETVISGPALEKHYKKISGGNQLHLKDIVLNGQSGEDPYAAATLERLVQYFGKAVAVVINIIDPDVIVIGGGVGNIDLLYTRGVEEAKKHVFNPKLDTIFLKPKLGDSAGVFGAALL